MNVASALGKTAEWHSERMKGIGGSDATRIMSEDWVDLWLEKMGRKEPEDLSRNLAVQMGTWTEPLNRFWFEHETGINVRTNGNPFVHPDYEFMRANLDGWTDDGIFEAKHVSAFSKEEEIIGRYYAQLHHCMAVANGKVAYLSVFFGSNKWSSFTVEYDAAYAADLIAREQEFWGYVERDEMPPSVSAAAPVAIAFDTMREVDMTGNNAWSTYAHDWLVTQQAAKTFDGATKALKELVEADVKKASGHGIVISRSKAGALSIKGAK